MNRELWNQKISKSHCPEWTCPICKKGVVALSTKSLTYHERADSKSWHSDSDWDADWIRYVFTAWATCQNSSCQQDFALSGTGSLGEYYDEDGSSGWVEEFQPEQCHPMPNMIDIPDKCPDRVLSELRSAFALYWAHPESCAGRIRVSLECLLDYLGVPRHKEVTPGKPTEIKLHYRIEEFLKVNPDVGAQLMALKWLGNTGSHDSTVSKEDLLDAFEIMEYALTELIGQRSARVAALAKKLTEKHGREGTK